jgi:hypothetical protein
MSAAACGWRLLSENWLCKAAGLVREGHKAKGGDECMWEGEATLGCYEAN